MADRNDQFRAQMDRLRGLRRGKLIDDLGDVDVTRGPRDIESDPPQLNQGAPTAVSESLPEPEPVVVVGTDHAKYLRTTVHTNSANVQNTYAKQIAGRSANRTRLHLVNPDSAITIYIGESPESSKSDGYPLLPGKELDWLTEEPCFGVLKTATSTDVVSIGVLIEYEWPI